MLKTKINLKVLVALGIVLITIFVLNLNTVYATELTQEQLQSMVNVIPDELILDITELEAGKMSSQEMWNEIEKKVREIWTENNFSIDGITVNYSGGDLFSEEYFYTGSVTLINNDKSIHKSFSLKYSNTDQKNAEDEYYVKNLKITTPKYHEVELNYMSGNLDDGELWEILVNILNNHYSKVIKEDSIEIIATTGSGGFDGYLNAAIDVTIINIFKNGILYDTRSMESETIIPVINVPSTVADDEMEAYIIKEIEKYYPEYVAQIIGVEKGAESSYEGKFANIPNIYTINAKEELENSYVIIRKAEVIKKDDVITNIKLEAEAGVVPSNVVLEVAPITEGTVYNTVKTVLTNMKQFKVYDINLLSDGVKIQPNGKVKITIPVPAEFNKENLVVYRVEDNGDKTEYKVTINGNLATFETDHFSTYVLAEKEVTTTNGEKDDTPNTGTIDGMYFILPIALISALGIIVFRKKKQNRLIIHNSRAD